MKQKFNLREELPEGWKIENLSEISELITDYVANGSFASLKANVTYNRSEDYAILLRTTDFTNNFKGPFVYINEHAFNFLKKCQLQEGDLILCNVGAIGTVFRVPKLNKPACLGPNAVMIRSNYNDYLYYWFRSFVGQKEIFKISSQTAQPKFNKTDLRKINLIFPPLPIQKQIVSKLDAQIAQIEIMKNEASQKLSAINQLPSSLLNEVFGKYEIPEVK